MNLDRRGDRLRDWMKQLPQPWPFPQPERFAAVDGRHIATPPQWRAGNGAWGCYRSHCLILEKCLLEGIDSYRVLRKRSTYRSMGLRKHGFHSMRYPGGGIVNA
jgi:hypothetical protein